MILRGLGEWHREVALQRFPSFRNSRQREGDKAVSLSPALPEAITDGTLDAVACLSIAVLPNYNISPDRRVLRIHGDPDVLDHAAGFSLGHNRARIGQRVTYRTSLRSLPAASNPMALQSDTGPPWRPQSRHRPDTCLPLQDRGQLRAPERQVGKAGRCGRGADALRRT